MAQDQKLSNILEPLETRGQRDGAPGAFGSDCPLERSEKEKLEIQLYEIFKQVNITDLIRDIEKLKTLREEISELHTILEMTKCCLEKACNKKGFFCC